MTTAIPETAPAPLLICSECAAPMAEDQRYCLECGARRPDLAGPVPPAPAVSRPAAADAPPPRRDGALGWLSGNAALIGGVACLLLAMGVGVLIGRAGRAPAKTATPQVVTVAGQAQGATTASFTEDWPSGKTGYTVSLQTLNAGSATPAQVTAAKSAAGAKGASAVGALQSDNYASLHPGQYVIYSGVYSTRAAAAKAARKLKRKFPGAKVVRVSASGSSQVSSKSKPAATVKDLSNTTNPSDYAKKSKKLPSVVGTGGKPPKKDHKKAGGGTDFQTIG